MMKFKTRQLTSEFGVEVLDIDLTRINREMAEAILSTTLEHALVLFRRQSLHDEDIFRLSSALGPVEEPAAKMNHSPGFKQINYIANINSEDGTLIGSPIADTDGGWHSDQAFRSQPATLSTLFCVICPESGGSTSFCSTKAAYEAFLSYCTLLTTKPMSSPQSTRVFSPFPPTLRPIVASRPEAAPRFIS